MLNRHRVHSPVSSTFIIFINPNAKALFSVMMRRCCCCCCSYARQRTLDEMNWIYSCVFDMWLLLCVLSFGEKCCEKYTQIHSCWRFYVLMVIRYESCLCVCVTIFRNVWIRCWIKFYYRKVWYGARNCEY